MNRLGERGIYTLLDAHQDVLARKICGEGMPNFYAEEALMSHDCDQGWLPYIGVNICKSIESYGFKADSEGNPLIEECQKHMFV